MSYSVPTSGALWWVEHSVYYRLQMELILLFVCLCGWVESLGDLLIVLFLILPFLSKNSYLLCKNREADQLQIVAGQGNNSFCQVSGLKGQIGKITNCRTARVQLLFTRLT